VGIRQNSIRPILLSVRSCTIHKYDVLSVSIRLVVPRTSATTDKGVRSH
jgi:hypothetical protein